MPDTLALNARRHAAVAGRFAESLGRRVLLMTDAFPFLMIGEISAVVGDFVLVNVETTHVSQLEGKVMRVHLDGIQAFFIEDGIHEIPVIR